MARLLLKLRVEWKTGVIIVEIRSHFNPLMWLLKLEATLTP